MVIRNKTAEGLAIRFAELEVEMKKYRSKDSIPPSRHSNEWRKLEKAIHDLTSYICQEKLERNFPRIYNTYVEACFVLYPRDPTADPML